MTTTRTLLVVGNRAIADQVKAVIPDLSWQVRIAESIQQAVNIGTYHQIDALVVAMHLPDGRGDTVFWYLVAAYPHLHTHTLFLVSHADDVSVCTTARCPWLSLPLTHETLQQALHKLIVPVKK